MWLVLWLCTVDVDVLISSNSNLSFPNSTIDQVQTIEVTAIDDKILEGEENIMFNLVPSESLELPGLIINIVDTISIIDDEG